MLRKSLLYSATAVACGLMFVNVYTSMVDAVSWGSDIPASIEATRTYFKTVNPATFFRIFSPANQILSLLALIVCWKAGGKIRLYCGLALVIAVGVDAFTFAYFYPRNAIMFVNPIEGNVDAIKSAWSGWSAMNWVRSGIILVNVVLDFGALSLVFKNARPEDSNN